MNKVRLPLLRDEIEFDADMRVLNRYTQQAQAKSFRGRHAGCD